MDAKAAEDVRPLLREGERLLWTGRPDPALFRSEAWALFGLGVLLASIATGLGWVIVSVIRSFPWSEWGGLACLAVPFLGFAIMACWCISAPWRVRGKARRAAYAITDARAIVLRGIGWCSHDALPSLKEEEYSFGPDLVRARQRCRRGPNRTDLVFIVAVRTGSRSRSQTDVGFVGLREWKMVDALLSETFGGV